MVLKANFKKEKILTEEGASLRGAPFKILWYADRNIL